MAAWNQCRLLCQLGMCFAQCDFKQFQNCCWAEMTMVRCWENSEAGGKIWEKLPGLGIIFVSKSRTGKPQISSMLVMFRYHSILAGTRFTPILLFEKCSKALKPHVRMLAFVVFHLWEPSKLIMEFTIAVIRLYTYIYIYIHVNLQAWGLSDQCQGLQRKLQIPFFSSLSFT